MNTLEALYFPGTEIYSGSQFPAFLLLRKAHLLQPVEPSEPADNSADIFISAGLCQAHTPCPLGSDRDRFLHLVRDIKERKDDYAAQLSALTLASLSARKPSVDDSRHGIISSLLDPHALASQPEEETGELLWQARLVLKIGEILDKEEEEVAVHLALLDDQQENVFKALQGEMDDDEESLLDELRQMREKLARPTAGTVRNRLAAWSKLYLAASESLPPLWLTHMAEAADILLEKYENAAQSPAPVLAEFALPANISWSATEAVDRIRTFQEQNGALLAEIAATLSLAPSPELLAPLAGRWAETLAAAFPEEQHGRSLLTIYHLADQPCGSLLGKAAGSGHLLGVVRWSE